MRENLRLMHEKDRLRGFILYHNAAADKHVDAITRRDLKPPISNRQLNLALNHNVPCSKLISNASLISRFQQTRSQFSMDA